MVTKCINLGEQTAATFNEDLMVEILVRLPVKSLSRFRCVCKSWLNLIKSPNFVDMHLNHSKTKTDLILVHRYVDEKTDIMSIHAYETFDVISELRRLDPFCTISGPCNGLLCALDYGFQLVLCNPSTKKYIDIPPSPFPCPKGWCSYIDGFGFGSSDTNDYKVVSFVTFLEDENVDHNDGEDKPDDKVEIYDLSSDSWREIEYDCTRSMIEDYGTLFNGALHWIIQKEDINVILSFNLSTEVFRDIELPNDLILWKDGINTSLTLVNDSLALFAYTNFGYNSEEQFINIWIMKEYAVTKSWTKQVSIGPLSGVYYPLMLWKNKSILLERSERQLVSCDLDTHEIKEFDIRGRRGSSIIAMVYQESLVSFD